MTDENKEPNKALPHKISEETKNIEEITTSPKKSEKIWSDNDNNHISESTNNGNNSGHDFRPKDLGVKGDKGDISYTHTHPKKTRFGIKNNEVLIINHIPGDNILRSVPFNSTNVGK